MEELTLDGELYVSTKRAAKLTGYAKDYVGQLCREGRIAARLVGRNWYVLESSLKTHRFGEETIEAHTEPSVEVPDAENKPLANDIQEEINTLSEEAWQPSRYITEAAPEPLPVAPIGPVMHENSVSEAISAPFSAITPSPSPSLTPAPVQEVNLVDGRFPAKESVPLSSKVVNDMQEAWQDWFIRTNEFKVSKETLLEENYEDSEPILHQKPQNTEILPEETPVTPIKLEKIIEPEPEPRLEIDTESEQVPIRRTVTAPMPIRSRQYPSRAEITQYEEAKEGRVLREHKILAKKKTNHAAQALLILIALVAIAVAFIGSGKAEQYLGSALTSFKPVQFLVGQSSINK